MPTTFDDDDSRDEDPLESDQDSNDDSEVVACPLCGRAISEDAERCPHCRSYVGRDDVVRSAPRWVKVVVFALLASGVYGLVMVLLHFVRK